MEDSEVRVNCLTVVYGGEGHLEKGKAHLYFLPFYTVYIIYCCIYVYCYLITMSTFGHLVYVSQITGCDAGIVFLRHKM